MYPPAYTLHELARYRQRELLQEADLVRLLRGGWPAAPAGRSIASSLRTRLATALHALAHAIDGHAPLPEPQPLIG